MVEQAVAPLLKSALNPCAQAGHVSAWDHLITPCMCSSRPLSCWSTLCHMHVLELGHDLPTVQRPPRSCRCPMQPAVLFYCSASVLVSPAGGMQSSRCA